mmetsp:Transcript_3719/g.6112  ORF Transcript_3719/g.6112 Transcript_3719/m.6112 type:complete len:104 (+) Transcript_3719:1247-1558(+)
MYPSLKSANAFTNGSPANACVHFDAHIFAEGSDYVFDLFGKFTIGSKDEGLALSEIGVDRGKGANGKSAGLSCTRLSLCNQIATHHDRLNRPLLNCTGFFKPI